MSLLTNFELIKTKTLKLYPSLANIKHCVSDWETFIQSNLKQSPQKQLELVNDYFNRKLRFIDDRENWHQADYWASPIESLAKGSGDCEDFAIGKYLTLRLLGVPDSLLRITYVKLVERKVAHMVLYYCTNLVDSLVLDNIVPEILPASQRTDLLPIYGFSNDALYLIHNGKFQYNSNTKNLSRWQDIKNKLTREGFDCTFL